MLAKVPDPSAGADEEGKAKGGNEFSSDAKSLDDVQFECKSRRYSMAFENQFHYGAFYAYLKLKEQEIRNVVWLAELVSLKANKNMPGWKKFVIPFRYHNDENAQ